MVTPKYSPYLAFSCLLLFAMMGSLILQTAGYTMRIPMTHTGIFIALPFALCLTYGYFFPVDKQHATVAIALGGILALLGIASGHWYDFTPDGMGYQQPSVEAIMNGWNPFGAEPKMLWQGIYPSGIWAIEAALATLYGSVETTKMIQLWWLFIALPVLFSGMILYKGRLERPQVLLLVFCTLSATVFCQMLTHYVDAPMYLAGLTFIGALLMQGQSTRQNILSYCIMCAAILFVVNAKLSGIYHAFMLCFGAVVFMGISTKRIPWKPGIILGLAGLVAILLIGYRPYVTSFISYGPSLFPDDTEAFSGYQRPSSFDGLQGFQRFFYSLFSVTGGAPHELAQLKWPWEIKPLEWKFSGDPDARTGGFGPLFALGFICSLALVAFAWIRKVPVDGKLATLAAICLLFSAMFPQSWWMRYVPFGYVAPFLVLLALPSDNKIIQNGIYAVVMVFAVNSAMAATSALELFRSNQTHFMEIAGQLRARPQGSVYLVPPAANYAKYNDAYMSLQRRLKEQGIETTLRVGAPCPHKAEEYAEYAICF